MAVNGTPRRSIAPRTHRITLRGILVATTPLRVHGVEEKAGSDAPLVVDGAARYLIPGTTLAGAIRASVSGFFATTDEQDKDPIVGKALWGSGGDDGAASAILVEDAVVRGDAIVEIRDRNGIDRESGAAADGVLFAFETLAAGTLFDFEISAEVARWQLADATTALVKIKDALEKGWVAIGAGTSVGLGRVALISGSLTPALDLSTPEGLIAALDDVHRTQIAIPHFDLETLRLGQRPGVLRLSVPWRPRGGMLIQQSLEGASADAVPLTTDVRGKTHFLVPGSSIKGVLRSQSERIMRTMLDQEVPPTILDQLAQRLGPVGDLFGLAGNFAKDESGNSGAITVHEVRSTALSQSAQDAWLRAIAIPSGSSVTDKRTNGRELRAQISALNQESVAASRLWLDVATHVSIDRWTGGAIDGALYTTVECHSDGFAAWDNIVLDIDIERLMAMAAARAAADEVTADAAAAAGAAVVRQAIVLLLMVLRDLHDGRISVGSDSTAGSGSIEIDTKNVAVTVTLSKQMQSLFPELSNIDVTLHLSERSAAGGGDALADAWSELVQGVGSKSNE